MLIEEELQTLPYTESVKVDLGEGTLEVVGELAGKTMQTVEPEFNNLLKEHGYTVSQSKTGWEVKWSEFKIALPIALTFLLAFVALQKMGLGNLVGGGAVTYGTVFLVGVVASLSTCMAVVGGIVLSMSATFAKDGEKLKPQLLFHVGRIVSFFILGGVIGAIGSTFTLSILANFILSALVGLVMLVLGINLLDVFAVTKKWQLAMPKVITKYTQGVTKINHTLTPLLIGTATFFLPCGFTQSMQLYTLSTGSFLEGGLTMLVFALGTLPVLAIISFSSFSIQNSSKSGIFFKTAGLIVIMFALFNLINSLVVIGLVPPLFSL
jgi:sulfite exporter TauE/SafE